MKIAFVVSTFPKLSETFIINQITGLIDMGLDVEIFAGYRNTRETKVHPDVENYRLMDKVNYFDIPDNLALRTLKAILLFTLNFHKNPKDILKALNVFKYGKKALSLRIFYALIPFLGKRFDITHFHFGPNGELGIYLKEMGYLGQDITSFHGYDANTVPGEAGAGYYSTLFEKGGLFTANTWFTKQQIVKLGCAEDKIRILPVGLRIERFEFSERRLGRDEPVRLLTIGRLVEKKGHLFSIAAVTKLVKEKNRNIVYTIAGNGPLREELESLARRLGAGGFIKFLYDIKEDEALDLYKSSHIFVLPCVTAENEDREGQALVLQEAQATGMPVISTFHNGIPEGMLDCKSGFLVPEGKVAPLAERIEYLADNPGLWPEMGRIGRSFVEKKYDIRVLNRELLDIYEGMLNRR